MVDLDGREIYGATATVGMVHKGSPTRTMFRLEGRGEFQRGWTEMEIYGYTAAVRLRRFSAIYGGIILPVIALHGCKVQIQVIRRPIRCMELKGVPSAANTPGALSECSATWVDDSSNLWMFGGWNTAKVNNILWKYDMKLNQWVWMKGDTTTGTAIYGTQGIEDSLNTPGEREAYSSWKDKQGNFWLMAGEHAYGFGQGYYFSDMWRFNPHSNKWAYMSSGNPGSNYGSLCEQETNPYMEARGESRARWVDDCGNFWLYGGAQTICNNCYKPTYEAFDDLWCFNPDSLRWTLANGSSDIGVPPSYNTPGVASPDNTPGGRFGSVAWRSKNGELYLFGGSVASFFDPYDDLWKFTPDSSLPRYFRLPT